MKRLKGWLHALNFVGRLRAAEAEAASAMATLKDLHGCRDCGAVLVIGHPSVHATETAPGQYELRCKWDQAAYERSPLSRSRARDKKLMEANPS